MSSRNRVATNAAFLRLLHNANSKQRKQLIKTANKDQILSVCECAFNILRKNIRLTPAQIKKLRKYRPLFYKLVDKKISVTKKRQKLGQSGGFLPALLAPLIPLLKVALGTAVGTAAGTTLGAVGSKLVNKYM